MNIWFQIYIYRKRNSFSCSFFLLMHVNQVVFGYNFYIVSCSDKIKNILLALE